MMRRNDWHLPSFDRERLEAALAELRSRLGPVVFAEEWAAGEAADLATLGALAGALARERRRATRT